MPFREGLSVVVGLALLLFIFRSMLSQWRGNQQGSALRGRYKAAQEWLEGNGYRILRVRERGEWIGYYGDKSFHKPLIADFVVRQGARTYAVKLVNARDRGVSGAKLRDQWFPLSVVFDVHGIMHVDVEGEQVKVIDFDLKSPHYVRWRIAVNRSLWLLTGSIVTLIVFHTR